MARISQFVFLNLIEGMCVCLFSPVCERKVHSEPVFALEVCAPKKSDFSCLISGAGDSLVQRCKVSFSVQNTSNCIGKIKMDLKETDCVELKHPGTSCIKSRSDGRLFVSAHWDHTVRVFDQKRLKPLAILRFKF